MKFVVVPILILLMLMQTFSKWIILADYQINREYIARVLCENKSRPMLHCNGKCQLAKKLAAEQEDANKAASNSRSKMQFSEVLFDHPGLFDFYTQPDASSCYPPYALTQYGAYNDSIFHPPLA